MLSAPGAAIYQLVQNCGPLILAADFAAPGPMRAHGLDRVRLHADRLAKLSCALKRTRTVPLAG